MKNRTGIRLAGAALVTLLLTFGCDDGGGEGSAVCDPEASWCRYIGGGMRVGGALLFQSAPAGMCCVAYGSGDRLAVDSSGIMKMYERGEVVVAAELGSAPAWDTVYVMAGRVGEGAWPAYLGLAMDGSAYACEDLPPNAYCRLRGEPSIDEEPDLRRLFRGCQSFPIQRVGFTMTPSPTTVPDRSINSTLSPTSGVGSSS